MKNSTTTKTLLPLLRSPSNNTSLLTTLPSLQHFYLLTTLLPPYNTPPSLQHFPPYNTSLLTTLLPPYNTPPSLQHFPPYNTSLLTTLLPPYNTSLLTTLPSLQHSSLLTTLPSLQHEWHDSPLSIVDYLLMVPVFNDGYWSLLWVPNTLKLTVWDQILMVFIADRS